MHLKNTHINYSYTNNSYQESTNNNHQNSYHIPYSSNNSAPKHKRAKKKHTFLYILISLFCLIVLAGLGFIMLPQLSGRVFINLPNVAFANGSLVTWDKDTYDSFLKDKAYMNTNGFFPGIYIDGIAMEGKSFEEAQRALGSIFTKETKGFSVTLALGPKTHTISSDDVPLTKNIDEILERAYALGRQNDTKILGTNNTPFMQRLNTAYRIREQGAEFFTDMTYDRDIVKEKVFDFASTLSYPPMDSQLESFDFPSRTFTFTDEQDGLLVDEEGLYEKVIEVLDDGEYGIIVPVDFEVLYPELTKAHMLNNFKKISSYTTKTTSNKNRNTNIDLSSQAINGKVVYPGEEFSFNEVVGRRTAQGGYKEAIAISGGQTVPDIGGGVCQTSTTLFNAVIRANLEITDRSPHAWPSQYVDIGMDATVNWPNLDFKFRNNQEYPIFIIAYYEKQTVTVEIYGKSLGPGVIIDLVSEIDRVLTPPKATKFVQNENLIPGTRRDTVKARKGYDVTTYIIWYQDGKELKRDSYKSLYKMYQNTVEYN